MDEIIIIKAWTWFRPTPLTETLGNWQVITVIHVGSFFQHADL